MDDDDYTAFTSLYQREIQEALPSDASQLLSILSNLVETAQPLRITATLACRTLLAESLISSLQQPSLSLVS